MNVIPTGEAWRLELLGVAAAPVPDPSNGRTPIVGTVRLVLPDGDTREQTVYFGDLEVVPVDVERLVREGLARKLPTILRRYAAGGLLDPQRLLRGGLPRFGSLA